MLQVFYSCKGIKILSNSAPPTLLWESIKYLLLNYTPQVLIILLNIGTDYSMVQRALEKGNVCFPGKMGRNKYLFLFLGLSPM